MSKYFLILISFILLACDQKPPATQAVASAHPIATQAGIQILEQGGNAFDAAVAVSATLAVVEPYSSGMGGGGFWLLQYGKSKKAVMIDGREKAPLAAHRDMYLDEKDEVIPKLSINGPKSAGIPGQPAALVHISKKYGKLPLKKVLEPAIKTAREGFEVTPHYQRMAGFREKALQSSADAARIFLENNTVPEKGYIITQPDLANTLEAIAKQGHAGFYEGKVAKRLVEGTKAAGGIWSLEDLKQYQIVEREPLVGEFDDYKIISVAPPSSGGVALLSMLNMLELKKWREKNDIDKTHLLIEVMRRAYRDRAMHLGDTDFVNVPVTKLIDKAYARELASDIEMDVATPSAMLPGIDDQPKGNHTTHFSILDKDGNRVAATLSVNYPFGSCFVPPGTGILLNDEMDDFSSKPGTPNAYGLVGNEANAIAPGKRMLSSMSPTIIESKDKLAILGTPGGSRIITMVLHSILAVTQGKNAKEIVSQPRFHHQYLPDEVQYEQAAFNEDNIEILEKRGYTLRALKHNYGNMNVVIVDKTKNVISAESDPRGEGRAIVK